MNENVQIQVLATADNRTVRSIAALWFAAWGKSPPAKEIESAVKALREEFERVDPQTNQIFIAERAGVIVGIVRIERTPDDPTAWQIAGLAVHPDHRRQGIGRALIEAAIAYARSRGAQTICSATHAGNTLSIAFHSALFGEGRRTIAPDGDELLAYSRPSGNVWGANL